MGGTLIFLLLLLTSGQNLLNQPESVVYDATHNRFLVSNCGDGNIIQVNTIEDFTNANAAKPVMEIFSTGLDIALGTHITNGILYVSGKTKVVGYDLVTAELVMDLPIPEAQLLNDVVSDANGFLYVSDSEAYKIFKINPRDLTYTVFVEAEVNKCNGLLFDAKNNRLIVCSDAKDARIKGVDLSDGTVSLIVDTNLKYLDGLAFDRQGNVYVSSWADYSVHRYDPDFSEPPVRFSKGHKGPADISYCAERDLIMVPNYLGNKIEGIPVEPFEPAKQD